MIDLKEVIIKYPGCLENASKLYSYLVDLYPEEKRNITIITTIFDCGIAEEIKNAKGTLDEIVISSYCNRLENIYAYSPKFSRECLLLWSDVYKVAVKTEDRKPNMVKIKETETKKIEDITSENNIKVGDIIKFGSYWQNNSKSKGKTPISWYVINKSDNMLLLLSEKALGFQSYSLMSSLSPIRGVTWKNCSLRTWLNDIFMYDAFNLDEQKVIKDTTVLADKNPYYATNIGEETIDKVFVISIKEFSTCDVNHDVMRCIPTDYTKAQGAWTRTLYTKNGEYTCWWWLRTSGQNNVSIAYVDDNGVAHCSGMLASTSYCCVRPAMWIELSKA